MSRSLFALVLVIVLTGCDVFRDDAPPPTFEAMFDGRVSAVVRGASVYTRLSRYSGIGTGDSYGITLRTEALKSDESLHSELIFHSPVPDSVVSIHLSFGEAAAPEGVYQIQGSPWAGGRFWVNGQAYAAQRGTVTVGQRHGRLMGTFELTDTYRLAQDGGLSDIRVVGRFEVSPGQ